MDITNVVKEGMANIFKGKEGVGGKLYLTTDKVIHKAHKMNVQRGTVEINLEDIESIDVYNNKVLGLPIKNGLQIKDKSGSVYKFVVYKREEWVQAIEEQLRM
ncbi:GRAM domain-containing protein [Salirhabdus sp. Marseille-P4669]|uniref:GRAM domain-containing protein n=1 Tax=Salirhabdus sp. Marseille-P4669 TaxID=2042310 RepID=UPI000C7B8288|nr:GRAM domain-containing protein [Salirhabdus sp. Marseille-P4669]